MIYRNGGRLLTHGRHIPLQSFALLRTARVHTQLKYIPTYTPTRNLGFFKIVTRVVKMPAYVGGAMAAGGSYVAYKVEQASSFTQDKLSALKDISEGFLIKQVIFQGSWNY